MNGITHKQARKWIDRRQDGLLKENQQSLLDEHLHSCDSCQSYSEEMELLASRLKHEFQARWDDNPGPSQIIVENVRAKAKSIPAAKRFSSGFQLAGGVTVLLILGIVINFFVSQMRDSAPVANGTEVVSSFPAAEDRLLAFASNQNGNADVYTMHADGSGLTNITNNPAYDGFPHWSPDGRQIAFESDRDGSSQIYLMDADGSNVTQLTHGGDANGFLGGNIKSPWSPDGRKLIFSRNMIGDLNHQFYVLDVATNNIVPLTREADKFYSPVWSPDGEHIAFILDESQGNKISRSLYVVDSQGDQLTNITENLPMGDYVDYADYYWSSDGRSITFLTGSHSGNPSTIVYQAGLDGSLSQVITAYSYGILDWWNGITVQENTPPGKVEEISWSIVQADGSQSSLETCQSNDLLHRALKRSSNGTLAFGMKCPPTGWTLYEVNPEGTSIQELLSSPLDPKYDSVFDMSWSSNNDFLAFIAVDEEHAESPDLYILNARTPAAQPLKMENSSSPSWQPVASENLVNEEPTPKPKETVSPDGLIAFTAAGVDGNLDIYMVNPDGSGLTNLTNDPAMESSIAWSPDGSRLAFVSGQNGKENIVTMNADGSDLRTLTDAPGSYGGLLWSPDGTKIAYALQDPDGKTANIYVLESNGQNQRRLTDRHPLPDYVGVGVDEWSPDSRYIYYMDYLAPGQSYIIQLDVESGKPTIMTGKMFYLPYYMTVNQDGSITYLVDCTENAMDFCLQAKSINQDGTSEEMHETMQIQQVCSSRWGVSSFYFGAEWLPDRSRIVFAFACPDGVHLYIANADGSDLKPLTSQPVLYKDMGLNRSSFELLPDGQSIVFLAPLDVDQTKGLYALDVQDALQNPELLPTRLNISASQLGDLAWQPMVSTEPVTKESTPIPDSIRGVQALAGFEILVPAYLPKGYAFDRATYDPETQEAILNYVSSAEDVNKMGTIVIHERRGELPNGSALPVIATPVPVAGATGTYSDGAWVYDSTGITTPRWVQGQGFSLSWQKNGMSFVIDFIGGELTPPVGLDELTAIANSMESHSITIQQTPTPEPVQPSSYGGLAAFTSAMENGNLDIYTMRPDHSELVNLTKNPAHDVNPVWSPDGKQIAFESDRDGYFHIYLMNADGSGVTQLTHSDGDDRLGMDISAVWSPDGSKLIFMGFNDQWHTYMINTDGSRLTRLPEELDPMAIIGPQAQWSPDGRHAAFLSNGSQTGGLKIHVVDTEEGVVTTVTDLLPEDEAPANFDFHWSRDGKSIYFTAYRHIGEGSDQWKAYEVDLAAGRLTEKAVSSTPMNDWWNDTAFITGFGGGFPLTWIPSEGLPSTLDPLEKCEIPNPDEPEYGLFPRRSSGGSLLIAVTCPNKEIWLYWTNPEGTIIKQLLASPIHLEADAGLNGIVLSSDDRYAALTVNSSGITYMYTLDIQRAMNTPTTLLEPVVIGGGDIYYNISWQPIP